MGKLKKYLHSFELWLVLAAVNRSAWALSSPLHFLAHHLHLIPVQVSWPQQRKNDWSRVPEGSDVNTTRGCIMPLPITTLLFLQHLIFILKTNLWGRHYDSIAQGTKVQTSQVNAQCIHDVWDSGNSNRVSKSPVQRVLSLSPEKGRGSLKWQGKVGKDQGWTNCHFSFLCITNSARMTYPEPGIHSPTRSQI